MIITTNKNYGKIAYNESVKLKRELLENNDSINPKILTKKLENFVPVNKNMFEFEFDCVDGKLVNFIFEVECKLNDLLQTSIINIMHNAIKLDSVILQNNLINFKNINFFANKKNVIKLELTNYSNVSNLSFTVRLLGEIKYDNFYSYNNIFLLEKSDKSEYCVFKKNDENDTAFSFYFNSINDLKNSFDYDNNAGVVVDNFISAVYSKKAVAGNLVDDELFILNKQNDNFMQLFNKNGTKSANIAYNAQYYATLSSQIHNGNSYLGVILLKDNHVIVHVYNDNLEHIRTTSHYIKSIGKIAKIYQIKKYDEVNYLHDFSVLALTQTGDVFLIYISTNTLPGVADTEVISIHASLLCKGCTSLDAVVKNSKLKLSIITNMAEQIHHVFMIKSKSVYVQKLSSHKEYNTDLYFYLRDKELYLKDNKLFER